MSAAAAAAPRPAVNPWIVAVTVTMATFMELLDTSIANVALPHIAGGLSTGIDESTWILTSYLVANAVILPLSAWLSRYFGRKRYYMFCVGLFTVSSFCCGLAPTLGSLIFFRVIQGLGGGGLAPCEQAILVDTFPPAKRSAAFGLYSMAIVIAPALGPTLGGWITDNFSWRWVFYINIPVGLLSLFLTHTFVTDSPNMLAQMKKTREEGEPIDFFGILLVALALGCLEVVLDKGNRDDWFQSSFITSFALVSGISLILCIWWELTTHNPVVDLSLLKERNFCLANLGYFLFGFLILGSTEIIPQMLQSLYDYTATSAGWALAPGAMVVVVLAPFVVRLVPILTPIPMLVFAFFTQAFAMWMYTQLDLTADYNAFVFARMVQGLGIAFLFVPLSAVAYSYLPKEKNDRASSLTNLFRNLGMSFGIAFVTTVQARREQLHQNYLIGYFGADDPHVQSQIQTLQLAFQRAGMTAPDALARAHQQLSNIMSNQAGILSYLDVFWYLIGFGVFGGLMALVIKPFSVKPGAPAGH